MNKNNIFRLSALCLALVAGAASADVVEQSFRPYADSKPSVDGLKVGMTIDSSSVAQFKDIIDPAFYGFVEKGWAKLTVGETTSFDLHPNYVEATRQGLDQVKLGAKPGEINGWVAGRSRRSRTPATRAPARSSPGTTSTATTGATARRSTPSTGSTVT